MQNPSEFSKKFERFLDQPDSSTPPDLDIHLGEECFLLFESIKNSAPDDENFFSSIIESILIQEGGTIVDGKIIFEKCSPNRCIPDCPNCHNV